MCESITRNPRTRAEQVVRDIEASGQRAVAVLGDIGNETELTGLYEVVDRELGPLTALVNNAAIDYETAIADFETDGLRRVYAVNVFAPFIAAREAIKRMSTKRGGRGGTVINIGSISARYGGLPGDVIYASSKGAMDAFTMGLARELGPEGIRVACVRPGLTRTDIFNSNIGLERAIEIAKTGTILGRIGEPEEVANLVLWLCSNEASYVTGAIYDVSGGR